MRANYKALINDDKPARADHCSTLIVGLAGETKSDFENVLDFLDGAQHDRVGCFKYSAVNGARANSLPQLVEASIKQEP